MTPTLVRANEQSGSVAIRAAPKVRDGSRRSTRRGRPPKQRLVIDGRNSENQYEKTRIDEIRSRARLYRLKVQRLEGEVLDRKLLVRELAAMFDAIREIVLGSAMTQREKHDLLQTLAEIPVVLEPAATSA